MVFEWFLGGSSFSFWVMAHELSICFFGGLWMAVRFFFAWYLVGFGVTVRFFLFITIEVSICFLGGSSSFFE